MAIRRLHLALVSVVAPALLSLPSIAQTDQPSHSAASPEPGAMRGTMSMHPTPKRQHLMEQMHHHTHTARHDGASASNADQLNAASLQRAQQGDGAAPPAPRAGAPPPAR